MDELAHASLKDGARLSLATKWNFLHNDVDDLAKKLATATGDKWIVVESIYSMDGDECVLRGICALAKKYDARIILDEAHSTGIFGKEGNGLANRDNLQEEIKVRVYTFGKAMGVHGACVACDAETKNLLVNFSRPFIYTTAPADHSVVSVSCAFDYLAANTGLQEELRSKIAFFRDHADGMRGWNRSASQIQVVVVEGHEQVTKAATKLQEQGFDVRPILSPTVKEGQERLRICLHTYNTNEEIESLTEAMKSMGL
jgi:8-amino-7-oxononanoate synthase